MAKEMLICTDRVRAEAEEAFVALLRTHWSTLHRLGFVTDEGTTIYRSAEGPPTYVEIFTSVDGGFERAHEHPDVLAIWEPMEPLLEERNGLPRWEIPALPDGLAEPAGVSSGAGRPAGLVDLQDLDAVFGALAHKSRRTMLVVLLARGGRMTSGEVAGRFECSWPTTTRHLRVLEAAGLVSTQPMGRERVYVLDRDRLRRVAGRWIARFEDGEEARSPSDPG